MPVELRNEQRRIRVETGRIRREAERLLMLTGNEPQTLSILLTDDRRIARLHERWMGDPAPTDVLSFSGGPSTEQNSIVGTGRPRVRDARSFGSRGGGPQARGAQARALWKRSRALGDQDGPCECSEAPQRVPSTPAEDARDAQPAPAGGRRSQPPTVLGDIVISVETAARRRPADVLSETRRYLVHGFLHLLGYDHRTRSQKLRMDRQARRLRAVILANARIKERAKE